jgi:flagellar protein FliO/FliZ
LDFGQDLSGLPIDKILQTGGALGLVLIVIAALAWILRRYNRSGRSGPGELALLGGLALGGRERLMLVRAGQDRVLIGVAPGQIRALHVLTGPHGSTETRSEPTGGFEKTLNGILASDRL